MVKVSFLLTDGCLDPSLRWDDVEGMDVFFRVFGAQQAGCVRPSFQRLLQDVKK